MEAKKIAVVTGGSSGMGLAISRKLQNLGVHVIIFDIKSHRKILSFTVSTFVMTSRLNQHCLISLG